MTKSLPSSLNYSNSIWEQCLEKFKTKIDEKTYDSWFCKIEFLHFKEKKLTLGIVNRFVLDFIQKHYKNLIKTVISNIVQEEIQVILITLDKNTVQEDIPSKLPNKHDSFIEKSNIKKTIKVTIETSTNVLNPKYTFKNFIAGDSHQIARSVCYSIANSLGKKDFSPLILYGKTGLGKTHLLQAICHKIKESGYYSSKIFYHTSESFLKEYIKYTKKNKNSRNFYKNFSKSDIFILDDFQFLIDKKKTLKEFIKILDMLKHLNKQVVLSTDVDILKKLPTYIIPKFQSGIIIPLETPSFETRFNILKEKSKNLPYNTRLSPNILNYLAESISSDIRILEGLLLKLSAYSHYNNDHLNLKKTKDILHNHITDKKRVLSLPIIIDYICQYYNISEEKIVSESKEKNISLYRQIIMYLAHKTTDYSLEKIGNQLKRNHSTVLYSIKKINSLIQNSNKLKEDIEHFIFTIKNH